jgi:hypothetical protein
MTTSSPVPVPPPLALDDLDHRQVARLIAGVRIVVGAALVIAPRTIGRQWIGEDADGAGSRLFIRAMGARDLALAVGTMRALNHRGPARDWVFASAASDAADVGATVLALPRIGLRRGLPSAVTAGLASVVGFAAASRLD